ncbi:hypothetical protein BG006_001602 [Podila minutissima]|uniref:2Fe-2S ferredoxin-type domain-containing protein n=1 Tax=Podila minutissima TaxID=64525 RepID=A0A9P5SRF8_9FUNG|nr:hypothetical protein BG006_001602 [Podila minutissima]
MAPLIQAPFMTSSITSPSSLFTLSTSVSFYRRHNSTTATTPPPAEKQEQIQGSAPTYKRHLLICTGVPAPDWTKKPELSDPYHNLLMTAVRGQEVKVNWTDEPSSSPSLSDLPPTKGPRHDLILFPDNIKFSNVRYEAFRDLARYLEKHPIGTLRPSLETQAGSSQDGTITTELVPGSGEPIALTLLREPSAVLVCVHGSRDCRCGDHGGELYTILRDMVAMTGLSQSIKVYGISHIGGHKFAPNTIMYPSGDWHGKLSVLDSVDAQQLLFDALANGGMAAGVREKNVVRPVMVEKWRGRMGWSQQEVVALYKQILSQEKKQAEEVVAEEPQSLFSAPGEELYEDDGLKEQVNAVSLESAKESPKPVEAISSEKSAAETPQKVKVVFETFQKVRTEIEAKVGERILDIVKDKDPARHNVFQALECTCGGELECATCHVYIEEPYHARLSPVTDAEEDMLEYAVGRKVSSRLGCQIRMKPELEGMVIKLPQY